MVKPFTNSGGPWSTPKAPILHGLWVSAFVSPALFSKLHEPCPNVYWHLTFSLYDWSHIHLTTFSLGGDWCALVTISSLPKKLKMPPSIFEINLQHRIILFSVDTKKTSSTVTYTFSSLIVYIIISFVFTLIPWSHLLLPLLNNMDLTIHIFNSLDFNLSS